MQSVDPKGCSLVRMWSVSQRPALSALEKKSWRGLANFALRTEFLARSGEDLRGSYRPLRSGNHGRSGCRTASPNPHV